MEEPDTPPRKKSKGLFLVIIWFAGYGDKCTVRDREDQRDQLLNAHLVAHGIDVNTLCGDRMLTEVSVGCPLAIYRRSLSYAEAWITINRLCGRTAFPDPTRISRFRKLIGKKTPKKGEVWGSSLGEKLSVADLRLNDAPGSRGIKPADDPNETSVTVQTVCPEKSTQTSMVQPATQPSYRNLQRRLQRAMKTNEKLRKKHKTVSDKLYKSSLWRKTHAVSKWPARNLRQRTSSEVVRLREKVSELEFVVRLLENTSEPTTIETFAGGRFTESMVTCVLELQVASVADEQIPKVLQAVSALAGVRFERIPCASTCRNLSLAGLHLAQAQIAEKLQEVVESGGSLCVQSDETTKDRNKLQAFGFGYAGTDGPSTLFLGLSRVAEKSAETAFEALKEKLSSISDDPAFVDKTLTATTCAMSDRAATQVKFNSIVGSYREEALPRAISNWETLSSEQQQCHKEFSEFFCQLHVISNLTDVVLRSLAEHETLHSGNKVEHMQPTVLKVIKEAARFLGQRSCGLHGVYPVWEAWCRSKGIENFALPSFLGHRFNIVFLLAARIVYLLPHILQFLEECGVDKPELIEISDWLLDPLMVSHLQVLGLIDQKITGPLWRLCEHSEHILETCTYATSLREWLQRVISNPLDYFSTSFPVSSSTPTDESTGYLLRALESIPPTETTLQAVLLVLTACEKYTSSVFVDYLPLGKYHGRDNFSERTSCAPASNRSIESFFGLISYMHSYSPNMRLVRMEGLALMKKNCTMEWLLSQPPHTRAELIHDARIHINTIKQTSCNENVNVMNQILKLALAKKAKREEKNTAEMKERARLTGLIMEWGFWQTPAHMKVGLAPNSQSLKPTKQRAALQAQIRFRQKVMMQPEPRSGLYTLSANKVPCSLTDLKARLLELLNHDQQCLQILTGSDADDLPGQRILHRFKDDDGQVNAFEGEVESVECRGETGQPMVIIRYSGYDIPHSVSLAELRMGLANGDVSLID